jgi:GDP-L-fucose synthase
MPSAASTALQGRRVFVAGHKGMVGSAIIRRLAKEDCEILTVSKARLDLRDRSDVEAWMRDERPDIVFMAAARVGGILANSNRPAEFIHDNIAIADAVIHSSFVQGVSKLLFLGSSCVYPRMAPQPISEDALLTSPLEPTNEWYAVAKIAGIKLCQAYRRQYGCDFISAMPTNLYGPNDNFDPTSSHVLPALIRRFHEARETGAPSVTLWGTGTPKREFLYVDDLADACVFLMKHYSEPEPINVGTGLDQTISDIAHVIARIVGYKGNILFDATMPDGTPRKLLDVGRLTDLGWSASTDLQTGLRLAYDWYHEKVSSVSST